MRPHLLLQRILRGDVGNVDFGDLVRLVEALGFDEVGAAAAIASSPTPASRNW